MTKRLLALLTCMALIASACSGSDSDPETAIEDQPDEGLTSSGTDSEEPAASDEGGDSEMAAATLVWGKATDIGSFDPHTAGDSTSWQFLYLTYDTLVEMGESLDPQPGLAESWENPDPTTWIFTLREGVIFSNGRAMTIDDVVGSLNRLWDPDTGAWWGGQTGAVTSVTAIDDRTVEIVLEAPNSKFLASMAGVSASILPMVELEAGDFDPEVELLGTGPYAVVEHLPDEKWTFEANAHYWGGNLGFSELEILIILDEAALVAALQDGRVDLAFFENPDVGLILGGADGIEITPQATTDLYVLQLNNVNPNSAVLDQEVRFAINSAIDRDRIAEIAMGGLATASAVTPAGLGGACAASELPSANASIDEAAATIAELAPDFELEILTTGDIERLAEIAQVIQQDLEAIGVTVTITDLEYGAWSERIYQTDPADFDGALSFYAGYGEATMLPLWWDIERAVWPSSFLAPNEEFATALRAAEAHSSGSPDYVANLKEACDAADIDSALIPLVTKPLLVAVDTNDVSAKIHGAEGYSDVFRFISEFTPAG